LKFDCKVWPIEKHHPAFLNESHHWLPVIPVRLVYRQSPPSRRLEAIVDSGAPACIFHGSICQSIGIMNVEDGIEDTLKGVVGGKDCPTSPIYYHKVKIQIGSDQVETMIGFSWNIAVGGLLGRRGFFDNFLVQFDCSTNPPQLDIQKLHRV